VRTGGEDGQATVELVGVLPLLAVLGLLGWQAVLAGQAVWLAGAAARAAARASVVGGDAQAAARDALPPWLERRVRVSPAGTGEVRVVVGVPLVLGAGELAGVSAVAGT